jgi:hypothetical protein
MSSALHWNCSAEANPIHPIAVQHTMPTHQSPLPNPNPWRDQQDSNFIRPKPSWQRGLTHPPAALSANTYGWEQSCCCWLRRAWGLSSSYDEGGGRSSCHFDAAQMTLLVAGTDTSLNELVRFDGFVSPRVLPSSNELLSISIWLSWEEKVLMRSGNWLRWNLDLSSRP